MVDALLPLDRVDMIEGLISNTLAEERYRALLIGIFAAAAVLLASVGLYGVVSQAVSRRTHEMGIRIALGAGHGSIVGMVLGQGIVTIVAGIGLGVAGATLATRLLATALFGVKPLDVATYAAAAALVSAVALLASYIPARRATRIDPMVALRRE